MERLGASSANAWGTEDVRLMLKRCIDPLATDEPRGALPLKATT